MLVAIEGIDGAGKTTLTDGLEAVLTRDLRQCRRLAFPDRQSETGRLIGTMLQSGEAVRQPVVFQALMTINRYERLAWLQQQADDVNMVALLDRYTVSGLVYGEAAGCSVEWLTAVNRGLPNAQLNVLVDISVDESVRRRPVRQDRYEADRDFLGRVASTYRAVWFAMSSVPTWLILDGTQPADQLVKTVRDWIAASGS